MSDNDDWKMPAMRPGNPDHTEVDPSREPDDKPFYCWCTNYRGKHKWNPKGKCPNRAPEGILGSAMDEYAKIREGGQTPPERIVRWPKPGDGHHTDKELREMSAAELDAAGRPHYPASAVDAPPGPLSTDSPKSEGTEIETPETSEVNPSARVQRWADVAMWKAPEHTDPQKPRVTISMCTPDPLGVMAMVNAQYTGRNLTSPSQVTDDERREAWHAATVSQLSETPLEWIQWSINFENVSRALTHQMVRTRMATYAQESQRFAVKDNVHESVKLPPSLAGTIPDEEFQRQCREAGIEAEGNRSREQRWRQRWDVGLDTIGQMYALNVNDGMPAEDARGLLPTNMLTRIHMRVDMKTLLKLAGSRLCTQAQFEWRAVFAELAKAIRIYGGDLHDNPNAWQFALIADSFRPVCFAEGRCPMKADSDRHCSIRGQVDAFAAAGIPSSEWEDDSAWSLGIQPISPVKWLADPTAARVAPGR